MEDFRSIMVKSYFALGPLRYAQPVYTYLKLLPLSLSLFCLARPPSPTLPLTRQSFNSAIYSIYFFIFLVSMVLDQ